MAPYGWVLLLCACASAAASELHELAKNRISHDEYVHLNMPQETDWTSDVHVRSGVKNRPILLKKAGRHTRTYYKSGAFVANDNLHYIHPTETTPTAAPSADEEFMRHRIAQIYRDKRLKYKRHGNHRIRAPRRVKRGGPGNLLSATVELAFVVDEAAYTRWARLLGLEGSSKAQWAAEMVYTLHADGVNERFKSLNSNSFNINVTLKDIHIVKDKPYDVWSTYTNGTYNGSESLRMFTDWVNTDFHKITPADHYVLVTGHNVSINDSKSGGTFGSMCTSHSMSIVQDNLDFILQAHVAHRLAQSIGATLDGVENSCRDDGYAMSPKIYPKFGPMATQAWWFSACSAREIEAAVTRMASSGAPNGSMCLEPLLSDARYTWHDNYPTPGSNISGDNQCRSALGNSYFACRVRYDEDYTDICPGMHCCDNIAGRNCTAIIPADGTPCANQQYCRNGRCVNAPYGQRTVADKCVFGDYQGSINSSVGILTCPYVVGLKQAECYNPLIEKTCCMSCFHGRISSLSTDCQYGDRTDCDEVTAGFQCYAPDTIKECCATCGGFRTAINDCNFGDRNDTICGDIENVNCYDGQIKDICCETCHSWKTGIPDCMYGDKIMTCASTYCHKYESHIRAACCETCDVDPKTPTPTATYTTPNVSPPDCQDELSDCEFTQCYKYGPDKRRKCCNTCEGLFPGSTMTSPSTTETTSALQSKSSGATLPIAVSVGCLVGVVIIVVVVVCWIRRRRNPPKHLSPIDEVMYNEYKLSSKAAKRAPIPQPRDPSMEKKPHPLDRQDTGTYAYIKPEEVASIPRHDIKKSANDNKGRDGNDPLPPVPGDYLELRLVGNYGYMEAVDKRNKPVKMCAEDCVNKDPYSEPYEENVIRKQENEYVKLQKGQEYHNYVTSNGHLQERM